MAGGGDGAGAACRQAAAGTAAAPEAASASLARQLHASSAWLIAKANGGGPALGGMPASDLRKTGAGGPHAHSDR